MQMTKYWAVCLSRSCYCDASGIFSEMVTSSTLLLLQHTLVCSDIGILYSGHTAQEQNSSSSSRFPAPNICRTAVNSDCVSLWLKCWDKSSSVSQELVILCIKSDHNLSYFSAIYGEISLTFNLNIPGMSTIEWFLNGLIWNLLNREVNSWKATQVCQVVALEVL